MKEAINIPFSECIKCHIIEKGEGKKYFTEIPYELFGCNFTTERSPRILTEGKILHTSQNIWCRTVKQLY